MRNKLLFALFGLALAALFGVQGCKVGKKYVQPELDLPETYRGDTIAYFADTISIGRIDWRTFFQDTILKDLIDSALLNNNDMRTALLNIEIADQQVRQNRANFLPAAEARIASANRQWRSRDFISAPPSKYYGDGGRELPENMYVLLSQFGTDVSFSWELDIWGKIRNRQDMVVADYLETHEARKAVQTNLIARVAMGYFNLLMLDAKIEVAKRNVLLNDSTLQIIKLQYAAGEITALAIQQTESQRLLAASLVPELEQEIALQENALRVLAGEMPNRIVRGASFDELLDDANEISLGTPVEVIRNRPDIRSAELQLIAANANANVQQAMRYPALTIGGTLGVNAMLPKNWFNIPGALLGGIGGDLTAPIFQNRQLKTQYEIARLERDQAEIGLQQTVLEAIGEVSDAVITVGKQREQLEFAQQRVSNSALAVRNAGLLFKGGYASYLEVITAQSNALDSDLALVELRQQYLASYIDLYRSLGGGWQ
ncbi:efflux transporter outer membrane subunit [Sphingobacterium sp. lm-10]|uniref:efflux transporter outer membrane subunit n=1 Tax=Sphingobacterium sp. lm-10 TaxID=2944904 RepID=UPI0020217143|nr:efflux transporter outer membrane subunit [Sphingobacterium sp. lm-10]MCL7987366.1 efflux transporter outer membrane subunit [Sphingobacterium sp. lm-10]